MIAESNKLNEQTSGSSVELWASWVTGAETSSTVTLVSSCWERIGGMEDHTNEQKRWSQPVSYLRELHFWFGHNIFHRITHIQNIALLHIYKAPLEKK